MPRGILVARLRPTLVIAVPSTWLSFWIGTAEIWPTASRTEVKALGWTNFSGTDGLDDHVLLDRSPGKDVGHRDHHCALVGDLEELGLTAPQVEVNENEAENSEQDRDNDGGLAFHGLSLLLALIPRDDRSCSSGGCSRSIASQLSRYPS